MDQNQMVIPSEEEIRLRSYQLWESEGKQDGKSEEYWLRAKVELETEKRIEIHAASMATLNGETTAFVLPALPISKRPEKNVSEKLPRAGKGLKQASV